MQEWDLLRASLNGIFQAYHPIFRKTYFHRQLHFTTTFKEMSAKEHFMFLTNKIHDWLFASTKKSPKPFLSSYHYHLLINPI